MTAILSFLAWVNAMLPAAGCGASCLPCDSKVCALCGQHPDAPNVETCLKCQPDFVVSMSYTAGAGYNVSNSSCGA